VLWNLNDNNLNCRKMLKKRGFYMKKMDFSSGNLQFSSGTTSNNVYGFLDNILQEENICSGKSL
jgi:hypothetical protein